MSENEIKEVEIKEDEIFEPVLGEMLSDDSFAFTLLSCHCLC